MDRRAVTALAPDAMALGVDRSATEASEEPWPQPEGPSRRGSFDRAWVPGSFLLLLYSAFTLGRLFIVGHGRIGSFVVAGSQFVQPGTTGLPVTPGSGYDGQFYYRMALDPLHFGRVLDGVTIDTALRWTRIGYPALGWLVSAGQHGLVPIALVAINLASIFGLGYAAASWASHYGLHALWGLFPAGYFGLVWSFSRDLTEVSAAALTLGGVVLLLREHHLAAGVVLAMGALCRETVLLLVIAIAVSNLATAVRTRKWCLEENLPWLLPLAVFGAWQLLCLAFMGVVPLTADGGNGGLPFAGVVPAVGSWLHHPHGLMLYQLRQLGVLAAVVVWALMSLSRSQAEPFVKVAFGLYFLLALCLSTRVWDPDPVEFRTFTELFLFGAMIALSSKRRPLLLTWVVPATAAWAWVAAALMGIHTL